MTFLPIAERELRIRARRSGTFALRCLAATAALAVSALLLMFSSLARNTSGATAFHVLISLSFIYCLYEGLRNTADCLSEEKRAGTLGFLFLTDLKGHDVVVGKLLATSLGSFYALLGILPAIGLPLLSGGVTGGEFWRAVLVLVVTLFFSLSAGMMVSSASRSERRAWGVSLAIVLFAAIIPPLLRWIPFMPFRVLSWTSPSTAFLTLAESSYSLRPGTFWGAVGGVQLLSCAFLAAASFILPRSWQQRDAASARRPRMLVPRRIEPLKRVFLLDQNPMLWLISREERIRVSMWGLVAVFAAGFLAVWVASGFSGAVLGAFAICVFVVHFLIAARVAFHVCHSFVGARDAGLLELLLSTPLTSMEILDGFRAGFKRLFRGPVILLLWIEGAVVGSYMLTSRQGDDLWLGAIMIFAIAALATAFVMDLHAVTTFGMWVSLKAKKPSQAFNKTVLMVMIVPLAVGALCCSVLYPVLAIVKNFIFFSYLTPLYRDFRKAITEAEVSTVHGPK